MMRNKDNDKVIIRKVNNYNIYEDEDKKHY